jgi:hypothetical protein
VCGRSPGDESEEHGRYDQANPESREDSEESLPEVPARAVAIRASGDQEATDAEEAIDRNVPEARAVQDVFTPESSKPDRVGDDHHGGENQPEEVQAVPRR